MSPPSPESDPAPPRRERSSSRRAHAAAVDAAAALLAEGGLGAATTSAVCARSGVSKATLYKHWPNRLALAIEAFTHHMARVVDPPDTGDTEQELRAHMRMVAEFYGGPEGKVFAELLAATVTDPAGAERLRTQFISYRREVVRRVWQRGIERGDIDPELDFQAVSDVLFGPIMWRLLSGHAPLGGDAAERIAEVSLRGVLTGTADRSAATRRNGTPSAAGPGAQSGGRAEPDVEPGGLVARCGGTRSERRS